MAGKVLAALADADRLQLVVHDRAFPEIALVDAPDVDSVEAENRRTAEELLQAADLCLFVTTAQRYADYVPWEFLRQAKARGVPLLVVVNRLPRREADQRAVLADARRRFEEAGLGTAGPGGRDLPMLGVVEGARDPATDGLEAGAIEPVRRALAELSADTAALTAVKAQALRGALAGLPAAVAEVAGDLEADRHRAAALRAPVRAGVRGRAGAAPGPAGRGRLPARRGDALLAGVRRGRRRRPLAVVGDRAGPLLAGPPAPAGQGRPRAPADQGAGVRGAGRGPGPPRRRRRRPRRHRVVGRPGGGAAAGGQPRAVGPRPGAGGRGQGAAHRVAGPADQDGRGARATAGGRSRSPPPSASTPSGWWPCWPCSPTRPA